MRAVILAAGYATRLYPLTLERPKHLLEVAGRPILDRLLGQLPLGELDAVTLVTNAKFARGFRSWAEATSRSRTVHPRKNAATRPSAVNRRLISPPELLT